jgi:hypothetical protein
MPLGPRFSAQYWNPRVGSAFICLHRTPEGELEATGVFETDANG